MKDKIETFKMINNIITKNKLKDFNQRRPSINSSIFEQIDEEKNINVYYNILSKQLKNNNLPIDSFYAALREYSQSNPFTFQKADEWVDIGHNITSFDAKTGVKAREYLISLGYDGVNNGNEEYITAAGEFVLTDSSSVYAKLYQSSSPFKSGCWETIFKFTSFPIVFIRRMDFQIYQLMWVCLRKLSEC